MALTGEVTVFTVQVLKCHPKTRCQRRSRFMTGGRRRPALRPLKVPPRSSITPDTVSSIIPPSLSALFLETSEVTSPASETPEPVVMETEAETPAAEPGERWRQTRRVGGRRPQGFFFNRFCFTVCAEVKPDAAVDDWEAIATDEEKGERRNGLFIVVQNVRITDY